MPLDLYETLAAHLDTLPAGYPRTASGVELRILRRLFTPEEAALALELTVIPEEAKVVARRARLPVEQVAAELVVMERKGLILSEVRHGVTRYSAMQFVVGFWEGQVDKLTPELVKDFEEYLPQFLDPDAWRRMPQMRVVPVNASIDARGEVLPYELVEELVRGGRGHYAVSNCICRQERQLAGKGCSRPMDSCLSFGTAADYITRSGRGRAISQQEMIDLLRRADEAGLVLQAANARRAVFICTCCSCCCAVLRSLKRHPAPASIVVTPFVVTLHADACQGCGACEPRCQMDALRMEDSRATLDAGRCIGCGLCVTTCPAGALALARKPPEEQPDVPKNLVANYLRIGRERGRFGVGELASLEARSLFDRFRT
jgi:Na+-translocating ferredoxin:NAD+ oxidoreductase subunit B